MQGRSRVERELLDAESMVGELVPPGGVYAFLAEHRGELFPDSFIADLFSATTGRPSLPADLIGSVLVLKELNDMSDPQTAEALKYDIRWKVACGRALTETSFDPSTRHCDGSHRASTRSGVSNRCQLCDAPPSLGRPPKQDDGQPPTQRLSRLVGRITLPGNDFRRRKSFIDLSATARFGRSISTTSVAIELDQPLVADPEVMRDLVEHDVPDLAA